MTGWNMSPGYRECESEEDEVCDRCELCDTCDVHWLDCPLGKFDRGYSE